MIKKILNRFSPSFRINKDKEFSLRDNRFHPVPINRLRVTPLVKRSVLSLRSSDISLQFENKGKLAVVIPFRKREQHLVEMIPVLEKVLQEQNIDYDIIVVEQTEDKLFNRGKLKNVGADFTKEWADYYCFHDVDILPICADYRFPSSPLRLVTIFEETWRKKNLEDVSFGGVVAMAKDDYYKANGYSNEYWGWGKEDDDLFIRMIFSGLTPFYDSQGYYRELPNPKGQNRSDNSIIKRNKKRKSRLLRMLDDYSRDGLSNLDYKVLKDESFEGYRKILVEI